MNWKIKAALVLLVAGALAGGAWFLSKNHSRPAVTLTLQIGVAPPEQSVFVAAQANSSLFKYLMGRQSGVKPVLAQKLEVKVAPNSSRVEARVSVLTTDQARRYVEVFLPTLQRQCGLQARLALVEQSIR
jgi:hypothetical protein